MAPGECWIDGKKIPPGDLIIVTKGDCLNSGGQWVDTGGCFVRNVLTRSLGESILELGTTYPIALDFRDQILLETRIGKRFLDLYYDNLDTTFETTTADYHLIAEFIETWLAVQPFVKGLLEANGAGEWQGRSKHADDVLYHEQVHKRVTNLLEHFQGSSPSPDYTEVLQELCAELDRYVGLSARDVLALLREEAV